MAFGRACVNMTTSEKASFPTCTRSPIFNASIAIFSPVESITDARAGKHAVLVTRGRFDTIQLSEGNGDCVATGEAGISGGDTGTSAELPASRGTSGASGTSVSTAGASSATPSVAAPDPGRTEATGVGFAPFATQKFCLHTKPRQQCRGVFRRDSEGSSKETFVRLTECVGLFLRLIRHGGDRGGR